jgi:hypothetical protein
VRRTYGEVVGSTTVIEPANSGATALLSGLSRSTKKGDSARLRSPRTKCLARHHLERPPRRVGLQPDEGRSRCAGQDRPNKLIDTFATDRRQSEKLRVVCAERGVEVIEARPEMRGDPDS